MQIQFLPQNKKIEGDGKTLLEYAIQAGVGLNADCAGKGTCGKCRVLLTKGNQFNYTPVELSVLTEEERNRGIRLACQVIPSTDCCAIVMDEPVLPIVRAESSFINVADHGSSAELGVVLDLGTTSLEMVLVDRLDGKILANVMAENPQRMFGADVISRISYGKQSEDHLHTMSKMIRTRFNQLVEELACAYLYQGVEPMENCNKIDENAKEMVYNRIVKGVVLGNTTMSHIFLNQNVAGLSKAPFSPSYQGYIHLANETGRFRMRREGEVDVVPYISGHVGADTIGCIVQTRLWEQKGNALLIDIGTNGEMVLSKNGEMICCSTAAGPAFEGASIAQGMRATIGAIRGAYLEQGKWMLDVIGDSEPKGICGSGIIDILSLMLQEGIMDETGRILDKGEIAPAYVSRIVEEESVKFQVYHHEGQEQVYFTQHDVREIQLAKAAIHAGIVTLLNEADIALEEIDCLYVAGAFGSNMNISNAIRIGLLPALPKERISFIGNGSLLGGIRILQEEIAEEEIIDLVKRIRHIELANHEEFRQNYIDAINFSKR